MASRDEIAQQARLSVRSDVKPDNEHYAGVGLLFWMATGGSLISPWWSTTRDYQLRTFAKNSDHFQGAMWMIAAKLTSVPFRIEPRDPAVATHHRHADYYQTMLTERSEFGDGWQEFWSKFLYDLWTQDNGAYAEVIGAGKPSGRIRGPALGLSHLDSYRCTRTSNPEYPVIYDDPKSGRHRFHYSRILYTAQQPSTAAEMLGVGHCWLTRAMHAVQNMIDIAIYKEEKLGSRPPRQMLLGKGVDTKVLMSALKMAANRDDSENLARFAKTIVVGSIDPDFDVTTLDLASVPDGFDERASVELAMALIALAGGFPVRWLWPATQVGATVADALFSHISGAGGGAAWHLGRMQTLLGGSARGAFHVAGKVLPPHLRLVFDYQDDQQDNQQAEIKKKRSDRRKTDLEAGVIDVRVSRQQAVSDGDLTEAQFAGLELQDGRLENGNDVLSLFESTDPFFVALLDLGLGDSPLLIALHDPTDALVAIDLKAIDAQEILVNARSRAEKEKAEQALAALGKLKSIYEPLIVEQLLTEEGPPDIPGEEPAPGEDTEETEEPEDTEEEPEEEEEEDADDVEKALMMFYALEPTSDIPNDALIDIVLKQFNFGARVGEVIRGQLARGRGGRFVNAAQLEAGRLEMIRGILGKLRARIGKKRGAGGAAAAKKAENRAKAEAKLQERGMPKGTTDALDKIREGDAPDAKTAQALEDRGLAKRLPDGTLSMTPEGRSVLAGANSGDIDKINSALAKAEEKKKPKAGRGRGGKKKPTAEEAAEKKRILAERKKKKKAAETTKKVSESLSAIADEFGVDSEDLTTLSQFLGGSELLVDGELGEDLDSLPEDTARRLAQSGLVKFDESGRASVTSAGRSLYSAAKKGDKNGARDVMARAQESVSKIRTKVEDREDRITSSQGKIADYETEKQDLSEEAENEVASLENGIDELEQQLEVYSGDVQNREEVARIKGRISDLRGQIAKRNKRAAEQRARIDKRIAAEQKRIAQNREQISKLNASIGQAGDDDVVKAAGDYARGIRASIRGLWRGDIDEFGFVDSMVSTIRRGLKEAWLAGAAECGIKEDELSQAEKDALNKMTNQEFLYLGGFAEDVAAVRDIHAETPRARGGQLGPLFGRGEMWIARYETARQVGRTMACADKKLEWVLGDAEHCSSCLKLAGKVKRASFWAERGIFPRVPGAEYLECKNREKGFNCQCELVPTDKPLSKGPLPGLP